MQIFTPPKLLANFANTVCLLLYPFHQFWNVIFITYQLPMCSCVYMKWVKVAQTCPTLCNPMDCIVIGILQARTLEWVAFPFSSESSQPRNRTGISYIAGWLFTNWAMMASVYMWSEVKSLSRVRLFVTPWMVAHQASPSMEFSRHEYWSGLSIHPLFLFCPGHQQ